MTLYFSRDFLAAVRASGYTKRALALIVAQLVGCLAGTIAKLLTPGCRVPHDANNRNTMIEAVCAQIGFPYERALSPATKSEARPAAVPQRVTRFKAPRDIGPAEIERRFQAAKAAIRARRLTAA